MAGLRLHVAPMPDETEVLAVSKQLLGPAKMRSQLQRRMRAYGRHVPLAVSTDEHDSYGSVSLAGSPQAASKSSTTAGESASTELSPALGQGGQYFAALQSRPDPT